MVGASLAGLRAAEEVRHEGHTGPVIIVGDELHAPYDRPPLSKQLLAGTWDVERIHHHAPDKLDTLGLEFRLGRRAAVARHRDAAPCRATTGAELHYDGLIVATGAAARRLPGTEGMPGVHDAAHARRLPGIRADLEAAGAGARVVVIGAGFIGSEVAATCHGLGARVTVVEALPTPLGRVLGDEMGEACAELHRAQGVTVRTGVGVDRCHAASRRRRPRSWSTWPTAPTSRPIWWWWASAWSRPSMAGGLGPDPRQRGGVRRGAVRRRRGGGGRGRGPLDPSAARASSCGSSTGPTPPRAGPPPPATCWPARPRPSPTTPCPSSGPTSTQTKIQMIGLPGPDDEVVVVEGSVGGGQAGGPLPAGGPAAGGAGLQPAPPADGLPAAAGRRRLLRRGAGRGAVAESALRPWTGAPPDVPRNRRVKARAPAIWSAEGSMPAVRVAARPAAVAADQPVAVRRDRPRPAAPP